MAIISKQAILDKTHYGLNIYSHILRLFYPNEIVLRLVGRDCGLCRNPFNVNKETLHIWIEKTDPTNAMSAEFARHEDNTNAIPAGNAFDFAELHYKQQGEELLKTLNKELFLRIGEKRDFYRNNRKSTIFSESLQTQDILLKDLKSCLFSFFKAPISNIKPHKEVSLFDIYKYIVGNYAKQRTQQLRSISDAVQARKFKAANFDYCTFSGVFTTRNDKALIKHSGLLCVDFDHLNNMQALFNRLLQDEYFDTQLLFRSPSGDGLKWIISINIAETPHSDYFAAVASYIQQTYGVEVDKSGRDISRACFIPHDPKAFINPLIK